MARTIYQIAPIDVGAQQGVGVLLPMNKSAHASNPNLNNLSGQLSSVGQDYSKQGKSGASVFAMSYSTEEQAITNLKNLLATSKGERYMQPLFGTKIKEAVFQPNTLNLEDFIKDTITEAIEMWLPYIVLDSVGIIRDVDNYSFGIQVNFQVTETGANRVIVVLANENNIVVTNEADIVQSLTAVGTFGDTFAAGSY
tara:strand:+ start:3530 stop:4120 length:591 start_codon:yes stop_codon:yes gene_type:complete